MSYKNAILTGTLSMHRRTFPGIERDWHERC